MIEVEPAKAPAEPTWASYSSLSTYDACPRRYAFRHVERVPVAEAPCLPFQFGRAAHAFEAFTRERRERPVRGEAPPAREDLGNLFDAAWLPDAFPETTTDEAFHRRVAGLLDRFWDGELATASEAIGEELEFDLALDPGDGAAPVRIVGFIDRVDRLPSGGIEVIDYKTGRTDRQQDVDESLQLSIYSLACGDARASAPRSGSPCTTRSPARACPRRARTSTWTRPGMGSWSGRPESDRGISRPRRVREPASGATIERCARRGPDFAP